MVENVVRDSPAHVAFAGNFLTYQEVLPNRQNLVGRFSFLGLQDDIMAVYSISNCYLNPKRTGGGSAIVYALAAGLPSLSCPVGDGYEAVRSFPLIPNYQVMAQTCKDLMTNPEFLSRYQTLAREEAARLCSRAPLVERIESRYRMFAGQRVLES